MPTLLVYYEALHDVVSSTSCRTLGDGLGRAAQLKNHIAQGCEVVGAIYHAVLVYYVQSVCLNQSIEQQKSTNANKNNIYLKFKIVANHVPECDNNVDHVSSVVNIHFPKPSHECTKPPFPIKSNANEAHNMAASILSNERRNPIIT